MLVKLECKPNFSSHKHACLSTIDYHLYHLIYTQNKENTFLQNSYNVYENDLMHDF